MTKGVMSVIYVTVVIAQLLQKGIFETRMIAHSDPGTVERGERKIAALFPMDRNCIPLDSITT
jgi:hypothetical protein